MDFTSKDEGEAKERMSDFTCGILSASRLNYAETVITAEKHTSPHLSYHLHFGQNTSQLLHPPTDLFQANNLGNVLFSTVFTVLLDKTCHLYRIHKMLRVIS